MSKRKSKKSKNTTLIVFLVITFIIAIALLLYFFLWKENYGEIRENMTEEGHGKGYEQHCTNADRCKENFTCADKNKQGKGTCKCKNNGTHFSKLTDEQKKFFKDECISNSYLDVYNNDLGTKYGCNYISGVWDGSKCLPPGTKICENNETHFSELTEEQKPFFKGDVCIPKNALKDLGEQGGCKNLFNGVWDGKKCLPPGSKIASEHSCYILKGKYDDCKKCCRNHVGAGPRDSVLRMSLGSYNPKFAQCVQDICLD